MTEKRYFINSLQNIEDKQSGVILCGFSQIVERLNEYDEKYSQLFTEYSELQVENKKLKKENKELQQEIDDTWTKYENYHGMSIRNTEWY